MQNSLIDLSLINSDFQNNKLVLPINIQLNKGSPLMASWPLVIIKQANSQIKNVGKGRLRLEIFMGKLFSFIKITFISTFFILKMINEISLHKISIMFTNIFQVLKENFINIKVFKKVSTRFHMIRKRSEKFIYFLIK